MTQPFPISSPELQRRRVLFAAVLTDPITGATVSEGLRVSVDKLTRPPIVNRRGYFVWLAEEPLRPTTLTITPGRAPFEPDSHAVGALPAPPPDDPAAPFVVDEARLLPILLRPTAAYPFPDNALVLRGTLRETAAANAPAVAGARVAVEWKSEPDKNHASQFWIDSLAEGLTGSGGGFAAALALPPGADPVTTAGKVITVRLLAGRSGSTRVGNDIELPADPHGPVTGRGNNWTFTDPISWSDLTPV
jgi:hypothetical protein